MNAALVTTSKAIRQKGSFIEITMTTVTVSGDFFETTFIRSCPEIRTCDRTNVGRGIFHCVT